MLRARVGGAMCLGQSGWGNALRAEWVGQCIEGRVGGASMG